MSDNDLPNEDEFPTENKDTSKRKGEKPMKERRSQIKLDSTRLTNSTTGLKKLYMQTKDFASTGNPVKDLTKLMKIYQSWHYSLMPKIEFKYFLERIGKLGKEAATKVYMGRLRQVYKGLLDFSSFEEQGIELTKEITEEVERPQKAEKEELKEEVKKVVIMENEDDIDLENAIQANEDLDEVYLDQDFYLVKGDNDYKRNRPEDANTKQPDTLKFKQG